MRWSFDDFCIVKVFSLFIFFLHFKNLLTAVFGGKMIEILRGVFVDKTNSIVQTRTIL
jgi:hypothetical protein